MLGLGGIGVGQPYRGYRAERAALPDDGAVARSRGLGAARLGGGNGTDPPGSVAR